MKQAIVTSRAPVPSGPYSQAIKVGDRVYVAGQRPFDVATDTMPEGIAEQTRQVLKNIGYILEAAGAGFEHVVKSTVHLTDLGNFAEFNRAYGEFFAEPFPVRTTVESTLRGILVEIDVIAEID